MTDHTPQTVTDLILTSDTGHPDDVGEATRARADEIVSKLAQMINEDERR